MLHPAPMTTWSDLKAPSSREWHWMMLPTALEVVRHLLAASRRAGGLDPLTARERDVLALIAEGRSNAGIATALVLTLGTVEKHVASIFAKLDLSASETDNRQVLAVLRYLR